MLDSAQQRANMVATQLRTNDVTDPRLIRAILSIPREAFVPAHLAPLAYMEGCIPLGSGRVLLDPRSFGKMAQLAAIRPEDRVLDVGCGTGYSTAVFAHLAAHVIGLEHDRDLAEMAGTNDGRGIQARFNRPRGITLDPLGNLFVVDTANNTIRGGRPDPKLQVLRTAGEIVLSWPSWTTNYQLESSTDLPGTNWISVLTAPTAMGDQNLLTNSTTAPAQFFRLRSEE